MGPILAGKLATVPCLLANCNGKDCLSLADRNEFLSVGQYLPLIRLLIEDTSNEASAEHRRQVYSALGFILKHHSGLEDLQPFIDLLFGGITDSNRSVRISAG